MLPRNHKLADLLSRLSYGAEEASVLFEVFLTTPPTSSFAKIQWEVRRIERARSRASGESADRRAFSVFLSRLGRDGLIKREGSAWHILEKGKERLTSLYERMLPGTRYVHKKNTVGAPASIIIFDIPEKERYKRAWLRSVLVNLECIMVQKSVWLAHGPLPRAFIKDIHDMRIARYIHIFGVTKRGTLSDAF